MITAFIGGAVSILVVGAAGYGVRCYRDKIVEWKPVLARFLPVCDKPV